MGLQYLQAVGMQVVVWRRWVTKMTASIRNDSIEPKTETNQRSSYRSIDAKLRSSAYKREASLAVKNDARNYTKFKNVTLVIHGIKIEKKYVLF
jgi:hypothetical protein